MRQVVRAYKDVTRRESHVLRELTLNREVTLVGIGVFEFLIWEKRERQNRAKAREGLVIEALASKLILRTRGGAGSAIDTGVSPWKITDDYSALEDLRGIKKGGRPRIVEC